MLPVANDTPADPLLLQPAEGNQALHLLADALPHLVWTAKPDGAPDYFNRRCLAYLQIAFPPTPNWSWDKVIHPDDIPRVADLWHDAISSKSNFDCEYRIKRAADGFYRWHLGRAFPVCNEKGEIIQWVGTGTDIEEQKQVHSQLQSAVKTERNLRERAFLLDMANDTIFTFDSDDRITSWNQGAQRLYGWSKREALGQFYSQLFDTQFPADIALIKRELLDKGHWSGQFGRTTRDGSTVTVAASWTLQHGEANKSLSVLEVSQDISLQKQAEEKMTTLVARQMLATRILQAGIWEWNIHTNALTWDDTMFKLYGVSEPRAITYEDWAKLVLPEDLPNVEAVLQEVRRSKQPAFDEFRIRHSDGSIRYMQAAHGVIFDEAGTVVRMIGANLDATSRRLSEVALSERSAQLEILNAQLEALNKDLEQFAYAASHDLKAPLRTIDIAANWLEEDLSEHLTEDTRQTLNVMRGRVKRMDKLLDDLLDYARIGRTTDRRFTELVNAASLLDDVLALLNPGDFTIKVSPAFAAIQVCRMPLQQIFMNLIGNAVKHHHKANGQIEVTVQDADNCYLFAVHDDGPGIPAQFQEQIFEMFQTLRPRDKVEGSGMGLSLVRKSVEMFGGKLGVSSSEGQGSMFHFTWPKRQRLKEAIS